MKVLIPLLILILSLFVQAQVPKEDDDPFLLPLKDLKNVSVSSIDFSDRSLNDSFASVHIISKEMIRDLPMFTLNDYFEMLIPGVVVTPVGTNGAGVGIRGQSQVDARNILTMWDGHSLNRLSADGNKSVYYSPLLNDIEHVEFVLGPGSLKHGTGA